jgi:hypothetical protein
VRKIFGFIIGLFAGLASCGVVFVLLSLIFRLPEGGHVQAGTFASAPEAALSSELVAPTVLAAEETAAVPAVQPAVQTQTAIEPVRQASQLSAFVRNALPFNMPTNTRGLALVMIVPPGVDVSPLAGLPLTVAIDPMVQSDQIGAFRAMGFEVLTLLSGESRNSVPALSQAIASMTGSVGVLDRETDSAPTADIALLTLLGEHGLAYVGETGFSGIIGPAGEAGLPAMAVGAQIDRSTDLARVRATLDRATIDVVQRGHQIVVIEMEPNVVMLMLSWVDVPKPRGMVMAPVSAVLRRP